MEQIEIIPKSIQLLKMDDAEYFSSKYKDYISNSKLSLLNPKEGGSIEKFNAGFRSSYSDSFELGSAIHSMILQKDLFYISNFRKPSGKLGIFIEKIFHYRSKGLSINNSLNLASESADYYNGKLTPTRLKTALKSGLAYYFYLLKDSIIEKEINSPKTPIYLSESIYSKYELCIKNMLNNSDIVQLMDKNSFNEYAILCDIIVTTKCGTIELKLKAKLDNFILDHENQTVILNDLKTTSRPISFFMGNRVKVIEEGKEYWKWFNGSFQKYKYYRQMGMYLWMLQCAIQVEKNLAYKSKTNMVVVETAPNFESRVYPVYNKNIKKGLAEMKQLLIQLAEWKIQGLMN